jgi:hypothetical protein
MKSCVAALANIKRSSFKMLFFVVQEISGPATAEVTQGRLGRLIELRNQSAQSRFVAIH